MQVKETKSSKGIRTASARELQRQAIAALGDADLSSIPAKDRAAVASRLQLSKLMAEQRRQEGPATPQNIYREILKARKQRADEERAATESRRAGLREEQQRAAREFLTELPAELTGIVQALEFISGDFGAQFFTAEDVAKMALAVLNETGSRLEDSLSTLGMKSKETFFRRYRD